MPTHHLVVHADHTLTVTHEGCPTRPASDGSDLVVHACDVQAHLDAVGAGDIVGVTDRVGDVPPGEYEIELRFDREFVADPRQYRYSAFLALVDQLAIEGAP